MRRACGWRVNRFGLEGRIASGNQLLVDFKLIVEETSGRIIGGQLVSTADYIEQMDVLSLAISKDLTVFDLVEHSWLCLPGNTPLVPFIVEAAQEYIRQFYQVDGEGVYAD